MVSAGVTVVTPAESMDKPALSAAPVKEINSLFLGIKGWLLPLIVMALIFIPLPALALQDNAGAQTSQTVATATTADNQDASTSQQSASSCNGTYNNQSMNNNQSPSNTASSAGQNQCASNTTQSTGQNQCASNAQLTASTKHEHASNALQGASSEQPAGNHEQCASITLASTVTTPIKTATIEYQATAGGYLSFIKSPGNELSTISEYLNNTAINKPSGAIATARAGYHFVGWRMAGSTTLLSTSQNFVPVEPASGWQITQTYIAVFEPNALTITFDANDGSLDAVGATTTSKTLSGVTSINLASIGTPTRDGYSFAGWSRHSYTVDPLDNPNVFAPTAVISAATVQDWIDSGYFMLNPSAGQEGSVQGLVLTLYAQWTKYQAQILVHANEHGTVSSTSPNGTASSDARSLYETFDPYNQILLEHGSGQDSPDTLAKVVDAGRSHNFGTSAGAQDGSKYVGLPNKTSFTAKPQRGYHFIGWKATYVSNTAALVGAAAAAQGGVGVGTGLETEIQTEDAISSIQNIELDSTLANASTYTADELLRLCALVQSTNTTAFISPTSVLVLAAQFAPNVYTIAFEGTGTGAGAGVGAGAGTGTGLSTQSWTYGSSALVLPTGLVRAGYTFGGWTLAKAGTGTALADSVAHPVSISSTYIDALINQGLLSGEKDAKLILAPVWNAVELLQPVDPSPTPVVPAPTPALTPVPASTPKPVAPVEPTPVPVKSASVASPALVVTPTTSVVLPQLGAIITGSTSIDALRNARNLSTTQTTARLSNIVNTIASVSAAAGLIGASASFLGATAASIVGTAATTGIAGSADIATQIAADVAAGEIGASSSAAVSGAAGSAAGAGAGAGASGVGSQQAALPYQFVTGRNKRRSSKRRRNRNTSVAQA